ncbi:MAG TPA: rhodanese-like domain-containing protein [Bacteroidales bacterium]|nr:rhodanese-like domain-containing protein [Bacteroidales bacterium]
MRKTRFIFLSVILALIIASSCKKEDPIVEAQVLVDHLESTIDPISYMPTIITAADLQSSNALDKVYIIDIRAAEDYDAGHIENAVNVAAGDILTHVDGQDLSAYEKIAVVCYSGQSAAWATSLLRLKGYDNAYSLKFGMASWHLDCAGSWDNNISNMYFTQFETTTNDKGAEGNLPDLTTSFETAEEILDARVDDVLAEGFSAAAISASDVFANTDNYYIVNYWPSAEYTDPGHVPGAYQYTPKGSLTTSTDLKTLPTDETIVVYCYTGQTSAYLAAYLRTLGYDAKSLKFGANGMIYDNMPGHQWTTPTQSYDVVTSK